MRAFRRLILLTLARLVLQRLLMEEATRTREARSRTLRYGRRSIPGQYYHVIACTAGRRKVHADLRCGREVVRSLMRLESEQIATSLAFVVMPDHLHWLMQLRETKTLSVCVASMKSFAARNITRKGLAGNPVWQKGYMDRAIRREQELVKVARYIVANPLRAGIVDDIGDYPLWDSVWIDSSGPL
jgi:REP element-mobilizing transposase RayT